MGTTTETVTVSGPDTEGKTYATGRTVSELSVPTTNFTVVVWPCGFTEPAKVWLVETSEVSDLLVCTIGRRPEETFVVKLNGADITDAVELLDAVL